MARRRLLLLTSVSVVLAGKAHAEWLAFAYTGVSHTFASDLRVRQPASATDATFEHVSWAPHPFTQGAPYYGIRLTYFPESNSHIGAAIDFTHYKLYAETAETVHMRGTWNGAALNQSTYLASRIQQLEISHGVNLTSINVQYRWRPSPFGRNVLETHAGAGFLVYLPHAEGTVNGESVSGDYQYAGSGGQIFGGTEYGLSRHLGIATEAKFDIGSLDINLDPNTRIETHVRTLHLIGGITFHF
jgi:hypothetical protein